MAQTPAAVQTALGTNANDAKIIQAFESIGDGSKQLWYVVGNIDGRRSGWVETTASDSAATQATAIIAALQA